MGFLRKHCPGQARAVLILCTVNALILLLGLALRSGLQVALESALLQYEQRETGNVGDQLSPRGEQEVGWSVFAFSLIAIGGSQILATCFFVQKHLENQAQRSTQQHEEMLLSARELERTRDAVIFGLAKLAESRDPDTGRHLERISLYATRLAAALRRHPSYRAEVTPAFVKSIGISSVLHDIGKVGIEDSILLHPGKLSPEQRQQMQVHTTLGGECILEIERRLGDSGFLRMAREIAFAHHERWDGKGYPNGLKGDQIPLAARIVAIADVYDALSVRRVYKPPMPHEFCVNEIRNNAGTQFDPQLVDVFLSISDQFRDIVNQFGDETATDGRVTAAQERLLDSIVGDGAATAQKHSPTPLYASGDGVSAGRV
ncbi:Cyclic di-GMP phosphodiesterase response regulator RpfG [Maioricimonas rarisocia]|uniref:Cyclic di-GMP phosphodiesterase response regulator RpfG n=1 Tax=Maioricimonas rarisocia TaxID=2528026 RepID=A0A517Z8S2_9PLAN|nr:HD domain-containing phosphohydrolase [Maioricimonas rarisocia]QDU38874.1 Cyclic di-GMP phosphodiesterase response regulator RpfG [Maioricimonas rarisocia]